MITPALSPFYFPGSVVAVLDQPTTKDRFYHLVDAEAWVRAANNREILVLREVDESLGEHNDFNHTIGYATNFRIVDNMVLADVKLLETKRVRAFMNALQDAGVTPKFTVMGYYGLLSALPNCEGGLTLVEKFSLSHLTVDLSFIKTQQSPTVAVKHAANQGDIKVMESDDKKRLQGVVAKGWGQERIVITNDKYCGKFMDFLAGAKFSMHFHATKDETWYVMSGEFIVRYIDTKTAKVHEQRLLAGSAWHNPPLLPHQLICVTPGTILEVSTPDSVEDNYRVAPGDSQDLEKRQ